MPDNPRKSPHAKWIDYDDGLFFITICTLNRIHYFGHIDNGEMELSQIGIIVEEELLHPEIHHPQIRIPLFVVMPNHIHAIVDVTNDMEFQMPVEQRNPNPSMRSNPDMARHVPTLSKYIASFKSAVSKETRLINGSFGWKNDFTIISSEEIETAKRSPIILLITLLLGIMIVSQIKHHIYGKIKDEYTRCIREECGEDCRIVPPLRHGV